MSESKFITEEQESLAEQVGGSPVVSPAPEIPAPPTAEDGTEWVRDRHVGPGKKFQSSPPAEVVPPSTKKSDVY